MRCCKALALLSLLAGLAGCGYTHPAGVALAPNPPPPPGYRAVCSSLPLPFNAYITSCAPAAGEQRVVVRAKG